MYGKLTIVGRLGKDPEMRYTQSGTAVTSFSVAVDQGYGDNKRTLWVSVSAWGKKDGTGGMAEAAANYLHKGSKVFVSGEPSVRAYMSGDDARASLDLRAEDLKFLDDKPHDESHGNGNGQQTRPAAAQATAAPAPQVSPDGNYIWDAAANAWKPRNAPPPPPPPPGAPAGHDVPRDVDPDDIPF